MTVTAGIDVGTGCVKAVLFASGPGETRWLAKHTERIRQRDPYQLAEEAFEAVLAESKVPRGEVAYVATTGDGENLRFATELADRVYIIEKGEIRYEGTPHDLAVHPELRQKYLMV